MKVITLIYSFFVRFFGVLRCFKMKLVYFKSIKAKDIFIIEKGGIVSVRSGGKISIYGKTHLFKYSELQSRGTLEIGENFYLNKYSRVVAFDRIKIGKNVTIAQFVSILDHDHNFVIKNKKMKLQGYNTNPIVIGDNVWIADKATILKGVTIGSNVIIAANTVVNKDVPNNCIVAGVPFKIIKKLNE